MKPLSNHCQTSQYEHGQRNVTKGKKEIKNFQITRPPLEPVIPHKHPLDELPPSGELLPLLIALKLNLGAFIKISATLLSG